MWLRQGSEFLKKDSKDFDAYYAALNKTITDHNFEGVDLDIEDGQSGCGDSAMTSAPSSSSPSHPSPTPFSTRAMSAVLTTGS